MKREISGLSLLLIFLTLGACGRDEITHQRAKIMHQRNKILYQSFDSPLNVVVATDPDVFSQGEAVRVTVTVTNPSQSPVEYGMGSSTCRFSSFVRVGDSDLRTVAPRTCTADITTWFLVPGESRIESWIWTGEVVIDGTLQFLPAGRYELKGKAGSIVGTPVSVVIKE
jgi:hypothetical protein